MTRFVGFVEERRLWFLYTFAQSHAQSHWWFPFVLYHKNSNISWSGSIAPYNNEDISQRIGPFFIVNALKLCTSAGYPAKQSCRLFIANSCGSITRSSLWRAVIDVMYVGVNGALERRALTYIKYTKVWPLHADYMEKTLLMFGVPESLLSDWGTNLLTNVMKEVCALLGITNLNTIWRTTPNVMDGWEDEQYFEDHVA